MAEDPGHQKRPRQSYENTNSIEIVDSPMEGNKIQLQSNKTATYASKVRPRDVKIDELQNTDELGKIRVLPPTDEIPFKSLVFTEDLQEAMFDQWKDTILIKVLGKHWFYPALVNKFNTMWKLTDGSELVLHFQALNCSYSYKDNKKPMWESNKMDITNSIIANIVLLVFLDSIYIDVSGKYSKAWHDLLVDYLK